MFSLLTLAQDNGKASMVYLEHSETLSFDQQRLPDAQILRGNVCFRHDSALMYCDSAYFFQKENSLHAFGNVHLLQGDSVEGFGDILYYDGNTKLARFRRHVRLLHDGAELKTDSLNYNRQRNIAYYFSGGTIQDSLNTLQSEWGQYTPKNNQALFKGNVKLDNPKFSLTCDTLCYNTSTYQADLVSPTEIIYEQQTRIYSSKGWYNTQTELSMLLNRSQIIHSDGMSLTGDTIYYDKLAGHGKVLGQMQSTDSTHHMTLYGNKGEVWETTNSGYATDSAMLVEWSDSTTYSYIHADTLWTEELPYRKLVIQQPDSVLQDSVWILPPPDSTWVDTTYIRMRAFYNVRAFREDLQLVCDSVHYDGRDSVATLCGSPVCWNEINQLSADTIVMYIVNSTLDHIHGKNNATAIRRQGETEFNQLAGKEMMAYLRDGDVYLVDVQGNAETVFYPQEEDGTYLGVNRTQSSFVKLYIENRQIHHVVFTTATTGVMTPLSQATDENKYLTTFFWAEQERPLKPGDIFLRPNRTPRPDAQSISAADNSEEEEELEEEENTPHARRKNKNNY